MAESDDQKRNEWTNNPFERVNHSTNFEDYAISTSDEPNFLCGTNYLDVKNDCRLPSKVLQNTNSVAKPFKISIKTHKFEPTVTPIISTHLSGDQRDHSFVDSCVSAGNSSADVTPSGTPQNSPYSLRKVMENNKMANNKEKKTTLSANPKGWFFTGLFNSEHKLGVDDKSISSQIPRNPSFRNLMVSNFDINAVGPTSW